LFTFTRFPKSQNRSARRMRSSDCMKSSNGIVSEAVRKANVMNAGDWREARRAVSKHEGASEAVRPHPSRCRREIPKSAHRRTANSAERTLTAVMAVPHPGFWEKSAASIGSNGSTSSGISRKSRRRSTAMRSRSDDDGNRTALLSDFARGCHRGCHRRGVTSTRPRYSARPKQWTMTLAPSARSSR
jgi:hypothetical protein